jgi:hypothetical protein
MTRRDFDIPEEAWRRIQLQGAEGAAWVEGLDPLVTELEQAWTLSIGRVLPGGSGSLVMEAETAAGRAAVLKIPLPWLDPARAGACALREAGGRGYAELIGYHEASGAMLLERLGKRLSTLG